MLHTNLGTTRPFSHHDVYPTLDRINTGNLTLLPLDCNDVQPRSSTLVPIQPSTMRALPLSVTNTCGRRNSAGGYARYGDAFANACCKYGFRSLHC